MNSNKQNPLHSYSKKLLLFYTLYIYRCVVFAQIQPDTLQIDTVEISNISSSIIEEQVNNTNLKTVQLNRSDLQLAYPILLLNSEDELIFSFDDLKGGVRNYYYTFQHCDQNWEASNLTTFDYLDGYEENTIDNYSFSFGTLQAYTHYSVNFPNDNIDFKVSGNYVVKVWEDDNRDVPLIVKRFFVWEELASINAKVYRPNLIEFRNNYQEINFTVDIRSLDVSHALDEIRVTLFQNGRYDNAIYDSKPRMITNDLLTYDKDDMVFPAGKEYRHFDTKTLNFQSDMVRKITKEDGKYQVYVNVDDSRLYQKYFYETDINGQYVLQADLTNDVNTEGDYAMVNFVLKYPYVITSGELYVFGELNNNQMNNQNKMTYDYDLQQYTAQLYLKQGYYNYLYMYKGIGSSKGELIYTEGNHFESENDYQLFIYQHMYDRDYDRIVGCSIFNSIK
ncbi:MAG: DUF5103 domain-containing protein [Bacteroidetes bacterium]|nr:DUF5103 domain-containing protein [Bacteroidota bacterium]